MIQPKALCGMIFRRGLFYKSDKFRVDEYGAVVGDGE